MRHYSLEQKKKNAERRKKWILLHPEYAKKYAHKYYLTHKEKIKATILLYNKTHRKQINKLSRKWQRKNITPEVQHKRYLKNREKILMQNKKYRETHKLKCYKAMEKWRKKNKQKWAKIRSKYRAKRRTIPAKQIEDSLRSRLRQTLSNHIKSASTIDLVGCSFEFLIGYLEAKFKKGMSWENYGEYGWHIDHVKPCCKFDLSKEKEQRECFHYTNLQPLWAKDNLSKGGKYES